MTQLFCTFLVIMSEWSDDDLHHVAEFWDRVYDCEWCGVVGRSVTRFLDDRSTECQCRRLVAWYEVPILPDPDPHRLDAWKQMRLWRCCRRTES